MICQTNYVIKDIIIIINMTNIIMTYNIYTCSLLKWREKTVNSFDRIKH